MRLKLVTIVLLLIIVIAFFQFKHLNYLEQFRNDVIKLEIDYINFQSRYQASFPKKKADFDFMLQWLSENEHKADYSFLKYGYNIKYDSLEKKSYLYSFGKDGIDNAMQSTPFNSEYYLKSFLNNVPIVNGTFNDFFGSIYQNYDILLLEIKNVNPTCAPDMFIPGKSTLFEDIQLFKGVRDLENTTYEQKFKTDILRFCETILRTNLLNIDKKVLISLDKNQKIQILCPNDLSANERTFLKKKLSSFIKTNDLDYFDFALFPIYTSI